MKPLSDQQRLFLVESDQLYRAWREVMWRHDDYRFGIYWKTVKGRDYLVRLNDHAGHGRSLGVRSDATELIYEEFVAGKALAKSKYDGVKARLLSQARLNQATRLGRMPHVIAEVLQRLDQVHALSDLRVVGTHALYAYEAMAAVELRMDLLASGDVDLLFDARKQVSILAKKFEGNGLLGLLKKVDKTFEVSGADPFRAINRDGFMVDFITQDRGMLSPKPALLSQNDLALVEIANLEWLANSPRVETVVISAKGVPVMMPVADPRAFMIHKVWLSNRYDREPAKKQRDLNQARMVLDLLHAYLPHYPLNTDELRYFPKQVVQAALGQLNKFSGEDRQWLEGSPVGNELI